MTGVAIRGIGAVGAFGCGVEALGTALGVGSVAPTETTFDLGGVAHRVPAFLADPAPLSGFLPTRATRRVDRFSRLALLGAQLALEDAGRPEIPPGRLGVVVCSGYGAAETTFRFLDSILDDGDGCASPTRFSNSVHNAAAAHISVLLGLTGPSLTVSQFELSFASGLLTASQWLAEHRVDAVLCGGVDEFGGVLGYCWERFFGLTPGTTPDPLAFDRQTAVPGEGTAFFLLAQDDGSGRHDTVERVTLGRATAPLLSPEPGHLTVLGADGHRATAARYRAALPPGASARAFAPCYGSFPTAQALDLAATCLTLTGAVEHATACCLKMDGYGGYGRIDLRGVR